MARKAKIASEGEQKIIQHKYPSLLLTVAYLWRFVSLGGPSSPPRRLIDRQKHQKETCKVHYVC